MRRFVFSVLAASLLGACAMPPPDSVEKPVTPPVVARPVPTELPAAAQPVAKKMLLGLRASDGRRVYLSEYRNQVVILNYWASWCPVCWAELRALQEIRDRNPNTDLAILAINFAENRRAMDAYLKIHTPRLRLPVLRDGQDNRSRGFDIIGVPTTLLLDRRGRVHKRVVGLFGFNAAQVEATVKKMLAEQTSRREH